MKAMILAAGRGERMRPLTDHTPKPLLMAGGRSLIEQTIQSLSCGGMNDIVINTAYLGEQIEARLGDGSALGVRLRYSREYEALETGGGIRKALPLFGDEPFLVVNGDIATDFPFHRLHDQPSGLAHLVLVSNPTHHPQGDFSLQDGVVGESGDMKLTFSGIGVYRPELFAEYPEGRFPLARVLRSAMTKAQVTGEYHEGFWLDVGTVERLQELDRRLWATSTCSGDRVM